MNSDFIIFSYTAQLELKMNISAISLTHQILILMTVKCTSNETVNEKEGVTLNVDA